LSQDHHEHCLYLKSLTFNY